MRERIVALYPLANVLTLTGFLATVLLLVGSDPLVAAAISLWFCFVGMLMVYSMGRKPLKLLGLDKIVLLLLLLVCSLSAFLTTLLVI